MTDLRAGPATGPGPEGRSIAGRMTAVMRAVSPSDAPRRLRVAVVEDGSVRDERLLRPGEHLTVGASESAGVWIDGAQLHRLFEHAGGGYRLWLRQGMRGRVALDDIRDVADLPVGSAIDLPEQARGRIVIGDTTLLFQLVAAPPEPARPRLPIAVERRFGAQVDWFTTVVASFSFLLHFFGVALVYSDWMDPVLDDEYAVAQLVETLRPQPPPSDEPLVAPTDGEKESNAKSDDKSAPIDRQNRGSGSGTGRSDATSDARGSGDALAADLGEQLAALDVATLRVLSASGVAVDDVLGDGNVPAAQLEDAARSAAAARDDEGLEGLGRDGRRSVRPGERQRLSDVGEEHARGGDATREGEQQRTRGPEGTAHASGASQGASVPGAEATVARMRGRFRHCYQQGLNNVDPEMAGSVTLIVKIGAAGEVLSVSGGGGKLAPIVPCLQAVVRSSQFQQPTTGAGGIVAINVTMTQ